MVEYTFKIYIADGCEHLVYGDGKNGVFTQTGKDLPFPEGLIGILDLDTEELESICNRADRALISYYSSRDESCLDQVLATLNVLTGKHIYFELLRLDWAPRIEQARANDYQGYLLDLLPHKRISHIPSSIKTMQQQIKLLFSEVLDVDLNASHPHLAKLPVPERMALHVKHHIGTPLATYEFGTLPLHFEPVSDKNFAEVLYPQNIYDIIEYSLRECVKREQRVRVCKNCGRWFAITGRSSAEYCSRPIDNKGRTCKDVGSIAQWNRNRSDDDVFKAYRKEYKKRFAWIKAGKIIPEEFYKWSEQARLEKKRCDDGEISLEEYQAWLAGS